MSGQCNAIFRSRHIAPQGTDKNLASPFRRIVALKTIAFFPFLHILAARTPYILQHSKIVIVVLIKSDYCTTKILL